MAPSKSTPTKLFSFTLLLILSIMVHEASGQLPPPRPNQTTLVFYLQDVAKGPNATVSIVTGINGRSWSYNTFGTLFVVDDPVMLGASPDAELVGRAQGFLTASSLDGANVNVVLSILFTSMQYSGSTLEIQGLSRQRQTYKEVSIVGGTGRFRFVRGFASFETAYYDPVTARSVIRLTLTFDQS